MIRAYFVPVDYGLRTDVYITDEREDGSHALGRMGNGAIVFEPRDDPSIHHDPTFSFSSVSYGAYDRVKQDIMDWLWEGGVRPSAAERTEADKARVEGELEATKGHLDDLKRVFNVVIRKMQ